MRVLDRFRIKELPYRRKNGEILEYGIGSWESTLGTCIWVFSFPLFLLFYLRKLKSLTLCGFSFIFFIFLSLKKTLRMTRWFLLYSFLKWQSFLSFSKGGEWWLCLLSLSKRYSRDIKRQGLREKQRDYVFLRTIFVPVSVYFVRLSF